MRLAHQHILRLPKNGRVKRQVETKILPVQQEALDRLLKLIRWDSMPGVESGGGGGCVVKPDGTATPRAIPCPVVDYQTFQGGHELRLCLMNPAAVLLQAQAQQGPPAPPQGTGLTPVDGSPERKRARTSKGKGKGKAMPKAADEAPPTPVASNTCTKLYSHTKDIEKECTDIAGFNNKARSCQTQERHFEHHQSKPQELYILQL